MHAATASGSVGAMAYEGELHEVHWQVKEKVAARVAHKRHQEEDGHVKEADGEAHEVPEDDGLLQTRAAAASAAGRGKSMQIGAICSVPVIATASFLSAYWARSVVGGFSTQFSKHAHSALTQALQLAQRSPNPRAP